MALGKLGGGGKWLENLPDLEWDADALSAAALATRGEAQPYILLLNVITAMSV